MVEYVDIPQIRRCDPLNITEQIVREINGASGLTPIEKTIYTTVMLKRPPSLKALMAEVGLGYDAVIRHYRQLERLGWLRPAKSGKNCRLEAVLPNDVEARIAARVQKSIDIGPYKGEFTVKAATEWIIAPGVTIVHNARPAFLKTSKDSEPLELDIFIPKSKWGGEYQGDQHFGLTKRYYDQREFNARVGRDYLKHKLCRDHGVQLIVFTKHDLSVARIDWLLPRDLPRRTYDADGPFCQMIDNLGQDIAGVDHMDRE